jgi:tetratricopeptide (TPR) repeat protein
MEILEKNKMNESLEKIINLIKQDNDIDALVEFDIFLNFVGNMNSFSSERWDIDWRKKVYEFGILFKKKKTGVFLDAVNKKLELVTEEKKEALEFIASEIIWNFFDSFGNDVEYFLKCIKELIKKYPTNPEFHHSYSHCLRMNGNYEFSIAEAKIAYAIEPANLIFYKTCFVRHKDYFDFLLSKNKFDKAEKFLEEIRFIVKENDFVFNNMLVSFKDRIDDHRNINKKIGDVDMQIAKALNGERKRTIEILGVFVAIIGFIFVNINIALQNLKIKEILLLMFSMALILIIFATSISYIFSIGAPDRKFFSFLTNKKFWVIIILSSILYSITIII